MVECLQFFQLLQSKGIVSWKNLQVRRSIIRAGDSSSMEEMIASLSSVGRARKGHLFTFDGLGDVDILSCIDRARCYQSWK